MNFPLFSSRFTASLACLALVYSSASAQSVATPPDATQPAAVVQLDKFVVIGSYQATDAATATKLDTPIRDIPQSIQVVSLAVLQDRGVTRIDQLVDTVSGIHPEANYGGNASTFFNVRGFTSSAGLRDGFRNNGYFAARDVQAIDHVEVLKGPSGVLYGASASLGGYINTVSKQPQRDNFTEVALTAGSYGLFRPVLDVNRTLNASGSVQGRLNVAYENNDTFLDSGGYRSFAIAPTLKWEVNPDTTLTALFEYNRLDRNRFDFGLPNIPEATQLSRTRYYGLDIDFGVNKTTSASLILNHQINDQWTWREAAHYTYADQLSSQTFPDIYSYDGSGAMPYYNYASGLEVSRDYTLQSELIGKFETAKLKHSMLFGLETARTWVPYYQRQVSFLTIDLYDARKNSPLDPLYVASGNTSQGDNLGLYAQDFVEITPQLKALAGVRADWFKTKTWNQEPGSPAPTSVSDSEISPRVGLVWQPQRDTSLYANWSNAFAPVAGHSNATGKSFHPEQAEQFEIGLKQSLLEGKLTSSLAVFTLTRDGILTADPTNPINSIQLGEQRSRGLEFDLTAEPSPGLKFIITYACTEAKVTRDNLLPVGDALADVPRHSGSLWGTYQFMNGKWQGVGFGAGTLYMGQRAGQLPNAFDLPGYWRTDLSLFYRTYRWKAQLNVLNVFDEKYFVGGSAGVFNYTVTPSNPVTVQGTLTYRF